MLHTLTMPKLSPTMTEGVVIKWHKKKGDRIEPGDLLMEIGTDKATIEQNALDPGWMREILVQEGSSVQVNAPIAYMTDEENEQYETPKAPTTPTSATPMAAPKKQEENIKNPLPSAEPIADRIAASPLAKKLAKEAGIDLSQVHGTGPSGRIMSRDLEKAPATQQPKDAVKIPLTQMRKAIADRLSYAKRTIPHFYVKMVADVTELVQIRQELKNEGFSYTVTDFIIKATALSLMESPEMRKTFDDQNKVVWQYPSADISLAVAVEGGLVTPVLFQAEKLSFDALSKESKRLAEKARSLKLTPEEYTGGCFTITNLGMFGVSEFYPIINPPQAAILAIGAIEDQLKKVDGDIVPRKTLVLSLSVDHRIIDGSVAAEFLQRMKKHLETSVALFVKQ